MQPSKLQCNRRHNVGDTHGTEVLIIGITYSLVALVQVQLAQIIVRTDGLNLMESATHSTHETVHYIVLVYLM